MSQVALDRSIGYTLKRVQVALHNALSAALRPHGLSLSQYACLELLAQRPQLSYAALARGAFVTRQAMHQLVAGLRKDGLVESSGAGRSPNLCLTSAGERRLERASAAVLGIEQRMLADLGQGDREHLQDYLMRCLDALAENTSSPNSAGARTEHARAYLRSADPVLRRLIDADPHFNARAWLEQVPTMNAFGALIFQVIGQQLSVAATRRLLDRLQVIFGGRLPSPREVLDAPPESLHAAGLSRRKAATIRAIASEFASHRLDAQQLQTMTDDHIERLLTQIPGVGPWTVHGFLIVALNREDVVLPGDLALRRAIERNYGLDHTPSPDDVLRIAECWRPYRSLATAYLFATAFSSSPPQQPKRRAVPATT